ncbi:MAG: ribonuclease P protein component [Sandaracinobacter sp.]
MPADPVASAKPDISIDRIRKRRDFLAANSGVRVPMPAFVLLVKPAGHPAARAGFTVSKKVGNAVVRNRARRRLREAARLLLPDGGIPGADHVFIARPRDAEPGWEELLDQMRQALTKARRRLETQA